MTINPKLLIPGWAGELNDEEYLFIRENLRKDKILRRKWGLSHGKLNEQRIRKVAMEGNGIEYMSDGTAVQ